MTPAAARLELYTALKSASGDDNADTLMTYLPAISSEELANRAEVAAMRSDLADLGHTTTTGFSALRQEVKADAASLRNEMQAQSDALRQEMRALRDEMHSELATFRREIHARLDRVFLAQIATTIALGTAILAT